MKILEYEGSRLKRKRNTHSSWDVVVIEREVRQGVRADDGEVREERVLASGGDKFELPHLQVALLIRARDDGGDGVHIVECCCCVSGGIDCANMRTRHSHCRVWIHQNRVAAER